MNENEVYNQADNTVSLNDDETKLLFEKLTQYPDFRHLEFIKNHLTGTVEQISKKRERLEVALMYYRNLAPRATRFFFNPELADKTLELIYSLEKKPKNKKVGKLKKEITLEDLFSAKAGDFKKDFVKILKARSHRSKTETFQLTIAYLWSKKKDFPQKASPLVRLFIKEFGKQISNKPDSLRRNLKFDKNGDFTIPTDISTVLEKYTK